jgi:peroxiredoxin
MRALSAWALALALSWAALPAGAAGPDLSVLDPGRLPPTDSELKVEVGQLAPDFTLPAVGGKTVSLSDYRGRKNVVISFVPAAFTPVCSGQWPGYHLAEKEFAKREAVVLGVTTDNLPSLHAWTQALTGGVWFPVLSDFWPHGKAAKTYGVLRGDGTAERALFVIDKDGVIQWIDVHDINQRPPLDELMAALDRLP